MPYAFYTRLILHFAISGACWYSFEMDMIITAQAHLRSLGFPTDICTEDLSQNQLRSLAGEAFGAPSCAVIMIAYYANPWAPWWKDVLPDDMRKPVGRQGGASQQAASSASGLGSHTMA